MTVRAATDDVKQLRGLQEQMSRGGHEVSIAAAVRSGRHHVLVAEHEGKAAGYLIAERPAWRIAELFVSKAHRSQDQGSQLLEAIATVARDEECTRITVDVHVNSHSANALYEKNGFARVGMREPHVAIWQRAV